MESGKKYAVIGGGALANKTAMLNQLVAMNFNLITLEEAESLSNKIFDIGLKRDVFKFETRIPRKLKNKLWKR